MTTIQHGFTVAVDGFLLGNMFWLATVVFGMSLVVAMVMRRQSAALRHRIWLAAMIAAFALPVLLVVLPDFGPQWIQPDSQTATIASHEISSDETNIAQNRSFEKQGEVKQPANERNDADLRSTIELQPELRQSDPRYIQTQQSVSIPTTNSVTTRTSDVPLESHATKSSLWNNAWLSLRRRRIFAVAWLAGVVISFVLLLRAEFIARALVSRTVPVTHAATLDRLADLQRAIGLDRSVSLFCSTETDVPLTLGTRRPSIILPTGHGHWTDERCRVVLSHELAHIRRRDVLSQLLARLACAIYWCHPLAWYAARRMRIEREFACDDAVLTFGEKADRYATHLVDVASKIRESSPPTLAVAMASRAPLESRVKAILQPCRNRSPVSRTAGRLLIGGTLGLAIALSLFAPSSRQPASAAPTDDTTQRALTDTPQVAVDASGKAAQKSDDANGDEAKTQPPKAEPMTAISGVVVDVTGAPSSNTTVHTIVFPNRRISAKTNDNGRFTIEIPTQRAKGALLIASATDGTMGHDQVPWEADSEPHSPKIQLAATRQIAVRVQDSKGATIDDATVTVHARSFVPVANEAVDTDGRAVLTVPAGLQLAFVLAEAPGKGVDYFSYRRPEAPKSDPFRLEPDHSDELVFKLHTPRSVTVRVVDHTGKPLKGVAVYPWYLTLPDKGGDANLGAHWWKLTNAQGIVRFDNVPVDHEHKLIIWTRKDGYKAEERTQFDPKKSESEVTSVLIPLVSVSGRVLTESGDPAKGATVNAGGDGHGMDDDWRETVTTDENGTFTFQVPRNRYCVFAATTETDTSPAETRVIIDKPVDGIELRLQPATKIVGRLTVENSNEPIANAYVSCYLDLSNQYERLSPDEKFPNPKDSNNSIEPRITKSKKTDSDGHFEFMVGPGSYYVRGPRGSHREKLEVAGKETIEIALTAKPVNKSRLKGRVVLASDPETPVANASIWSEPSTVLGINIRATTDGNGTFESYGPEVPHLIGAFDKEGGLGTIVKLPASATTVELALKPTATIQGILFDPKSNTPATTREVSCGIHIEYTDGDGVFTTGFATSIVTDETGAFRLKGIAPGHTYELRVVASRDADGSPRSWSLLEKVELETSGVTDLGTVSIPEQRRELTLADRIARAFPDPTKTATVVDERLGDAKSGYAQILLIIANPESDITQQLFRLKQDYSSGNRPLRSAMANYFIVGISADEAELTQRYGVAAPTTEELNFAILNRDGELVAERVSTDLAKTDGRLSAKKLTEFLDSHHIELPDAKAIYDAGLARAKNEDKRMIIQVSGPKCYPCILLSRYLEAHKELIAKDYVYLKLDSRMRNAQELIAGLRVENEASIPWTTILSNDGDQLATSDDAEKGNIGFPSSDVGRAHFQEMLESTRQRLTDKEVERLMKALDE